MPLKSKRRTSLLILMLIVLSAVLPPVYTQHASTDVDISLSVSLKGYSDVSILGMRYNATQGFDPEWDKVDPPPSPVGIVSYFWYPDNPTSPVDLRRLSTSILPVEYPANWMLKVKPSSISGEATISWDAAEIDMIPSNYPVLLLDSEGAVIADMRTVFEYNFAAEEDITYDFTIQMPEIISINVDPSDIDFGSIVQSQSSESQDITITITSNVDVNVTASVTGETTSDFYAENLWLTVNNTQTDLAGFSCNILENEPPKVVGIILSVPLNAPIGLQEGTLVFWAEASG